MKWNDFLKEKAAYQQTWELLKNEHGGDSRKFLNKSYLVICYDHRQIGFDADAFSIARENSDFFISDRHCQAYIKLLEEYKQVENAINSEAKERILDKIRFFDTDEFSVVEHQVEVRFPGVRMEYIQEIKKSKYCSKELTDMSRVSVKVVLSREAEG